MKNIFKIGLLMLFVLSGQLLLAQATPPSAAEQDKDFWAKTFTYLFIGASVLTTIGVGLVLNKVLGMMTKFYQADILAKQGIVQSPEVAATAMRTSAWSSFMKKMTNATPIEKEQDIMLEHGFDGIHELDNKLPPWWLAMFYISIGFALVYMTYYHFTDTGKSSIQQYNTEMEVAEASVKQYLAHQADAVDETNVKALSDADNLAAGKLIFNTSCVACHGEAGQGTVGPNLTDEYWLHGGGIKNIFKTIKYGVPAKGMIAWQEQLRSSDMQKVASYILTLEGTKPANPKAPQGDKYVPEAANAAPAPTTETK